MKIDSKKFDIKCIGGNISFTPKHSVWKKIWQFIVHKQTYVINRNAQQYADFVYKIPELFDKEGKTIFKVRNELKEFIVNGESFIVKSYVRPHIVNRLVYGSIRPSKATRSYVYALKLLDAEIATPTPIGFCEDRHFCLLNRSYLITKRSKCSHEFREVLDDLAYPRRNELIRSVAKYAALMHDRGILPLDFSSGNILFENLGNRFKLEMIDLNRMKFQCVDDIKGCKSFERLDLEEESLRFLASEYAKARCMDESRCQELVLKYRDPRMKNYCP